MKARKKQEQPNAQPVPAQGATLAIYRAALARLNECRELCPGVGGDVDAMNLRYLIQHASANQFTATQAAKTLESLGRALGIGCGSEVHALKNAAMMEHRFNNWPAVVKALRKCNAQLTLFLGGCDAREIRQSFAGMMSASKAADKLLSQIQP